MKLQTSNGGITINGVTYTGNNLSIVNGVVTVDGKVQTTINDPTIIVNVVGNVLSLDSGSGDVSVTGDVTTLTTRSGSVQCRNVQGNITTTSGSINAHTVHGTVTTKSGNIIHKY